jgi:transposase-like protein
MRPLVHHLPIELSGSPGDDGWARHVVSHSTILRSVSRYVPEFEKRFNRFAQPVNTSWRVDETYINIRGKWNYLYRAVDKHDKTVDFLLRPDRGVAAAQAFFRKALSTSLPSWPRKIALDGHLQSHMALRLLRREGRRLQSFGSAAITLGGIELAHRIRKRQFSFGRGRYQNYGSLKQIWDRALA